MAVRAVQEISAPPLAHARDVRQLVADASGDENAAGTQVSAAGEMDNESWVNAHDAVVDDRDPVTGHLSAAGRQELLRGHAVSGEIPVHMRGRGVSWMAGVDDSHSP